MKRDGGTLKRSFGSVMRTLCDLIVLNWLCVLCMLPVVTAGPALCALYAVTLKLVRGESVHVARGFLDAFRADFRQGLVLGLLTLGVGLVAAGDVFFALQQTGLLRTLFLTVATVVAAVFLTLLSYAFPLQAMFRNSLRGQVKNAFALAFCAPGKTIRLWLTVLLLPPLVVALLGFVYFVAGVSGPAWLASGVLRQIFDRVNGGPVVPPPAEEEPE